MSTTKNTSDNDPLDIPKGVAVIRSKLKALPASAGVYRMMNAKGDVLYVGKAKNLKNRVASYTRPNASVHRIQRMIGETRAMEFITTHTEADALLLEANMIKEMKPRYNVLLRDDRSFPYILLKTDTPWPQITKHRGARGKKGDYFGPFASVSSVNRTLNTLQKIFLLRTCTDATLNSRTRPCLLYQIKRCAAPCVGKVTPENYQKLVDDARAFLEGRSTKIQKELSRNMQKASDALDFEEAARLRDRLRALTAIQSHQNVNATSLGDADVIALHRNGGQSCVQVFFYRGGQNWGNRAYFPRHDKSVEDPALLDAFIAQFYDNKPAPRSILTNITPESADLLGEALSHRAGHRVKISSPLRGEKRALLKEAEQNAKGALDRKQAENASQIALMNALADVFDLDAAPNRIEVYDNSHIQGSHAIGAMIVADREGFRKAAYRTFNIKGRDVAPGDDVAMMKEVLGRRFKRLQKDDPAKTAGDWPDLILIDGGRTQLGAVMTALDELGITDMPTVAISKGPDRNAGREQFHMPDRESFTLPHDHPVMYFLQRLRDESHRFAIGTHRAKRTKSLKSSPLDQIAGVGPGRKRALLHHFGSAKAVEGAGIKDLEAVEGISKAMAQSIYDFFHDRG